VERETWSPTLRAAWAVVAVVAAAAVGRLGEANPSTAGFLLLIAVLFGATWGGLVAGIAASLAAAVLFPFFLPPLDAIHIADAENWVALGAFLIAAILASRLVTKAREQAARAEARALAIEAVNDFAVRQLVADPELPSLAGMAAEALLAMGARGAGVIREREGRAEVLVWSGAPSPAYVLELGRRLGARSERFRLEGHAEQDLFFPLVVGGRQVGVLACIGLTASGRAAESVARILVLALERARLASERAHLEAVRESEALKTAILRAVSHDLSTPLTAIGFQVAALERQLADPEARSTVAELATQTARLRRRIEDLLAMGRLEAGTIALRPEPVPPADLFRAARESLSGLLRSIEVRVAPDCPDALVDPSLGLEIVVNLLENADRASDDGRPVELVASGAGERVRIGVLDRGRGVAGVPEGHEIEAGDVLPRGLGLEIASRFAAACAGSVRLEARPGGGVAAWLELPAAPVGALS
jgi:two-component system sensor histidine kinase KdpD